MTHLCRRPQTRDQYIAKPLPYAISSVTAAMPHTMPSMVSRLRVYVAAQRGPGFRIISVSMLETSSTEARGSPDGRANLTSGFPLATNRSFKLLTRPPHSAAPRWDRSLRSARRIHRRDDCHRAQQSTGESPIARWRQPGEKLRHGHQIQQGAKAESDPMPSPPLTSTMRIVSTKNCIMMVRAGRRQPCARQSRVCARAPRPA